MVVVHTARPIKDRLMNQQRVQSQYEQKSHYIIFVFKIDTNDIGYIWLPSQTAPFILRASCTVFVPIGLVYVRLASSKSRPVFTQYRKPKGDGYRCSINYRLPRGS